MRDEELAAARPAPRPARQPIRGMHVFGSYLVVQLPGWLLAAIAAWALHRAGVVSAWLAAALLSALLLKDLLLFPAMRRFYQSRPAAGRMIGETGGAVTDLSPHGFVRVRGELWRARAARPVTRGARIRVREIHGLTLLVDAAE